MPSPRQTIRLPLLALLLLVLAGALLLPLRQIRQHAGLSPLALPEETPPSITFTTIALGGFRGILADILWLRSTRLQQEGDYIEMVQLADWITRLEPRFPPVWSFQAWNLAYNISVMFPAPEDRWRWVRHGIHLLRDQGLLYNPRSPELHRELAWLFLHKLGGRVDSAFPYYQRAWSQELDTVLNAPDRDLLLRREYQLDPDVMRVLDADYGPLDWRIPQTHALYWAHQGLPYANGFDAVLLRRIMLLALQDLLFRSAWIDLASGESLPLFNPARADVTARAYEEALRTHPDIPAFRDHAIDFFGAAIFQLTLLGRDAQAEALLARLRLIAPQTPDTPLALITNLLTHGAPHDLQALSTAIAYLDHLRAQWIEAGRPTEADGIQRLITRLLPSSRP